MAGTQGLTLSRYVTPAESRRQFPTLAKAHDGGNSLKGTVSAGIQTCRAPNTDRGGPRALSIIEAALWQSHSVSL